MIRVKCSCCKSRKGMAFSVMAYFFILEIFCILTIITQIKKAIIITEDEKLKLHLKTSHTKRFRIRMGLIKLGQKQNNAEIIKAKF